MPRYRITTSETLYIYHELDIPDDCADPAQYFLDNEHLARQLGSDSADWQIDFIEKDESDD
jgi:hypothetical protein